MKKYLAIALFSVGVLTTSAQHKQQAFEIQGKGIFKSTWVMNKNISDLGDEQNYAAAWGHSYGIGLNYYFNGIGPGIGLDFQMGKHKGGYAGTYNDSSSTKYTSNIQYNTMNIALMFKLKSDYGGYLEVGPQITLLSNPVFSYKDPSTSVKINDANSDMYMAKKISSYYSPNYISLILGFGTGIDIADNLSIAIGLRFEGSFTDVKGLDAQANDLNDSSRYPEKNSTYAIAGGLTLGLTYIIGEDR